MQKKNQGRFTLIAFIVFAIIIAGSLHSCTDHTSGTIKMFSENYQKYVEVLASDEFEGRAPVTSGGEKTKKFIEDEFRRIGLKPYKGNTYRQAVPLVEITAGNFSGLSIRDKRSEIFSFNYLDEMIVGTSRLTDKISLGGSEIIFAGYGIVAPEYAWNDYEGIDVKGKTVLVLVNDPGYSLEDKNFFTGKAMTYYGRWTYKYEEAARQGASGVLIIHETGPAGYGWEVVRNSWSGPQLILGGNNFLPHVEVQGWIQENVAALLFEKAGLSLDNVKTMAVQRGFKAFSLNMTASVNFDVQYTQSVSHNVIGFVEGSKYPDESVVYMAHWDHLGKAETPEGTKIYNGAIDNATGTAAVIAIAEKFAAMKPAPQRSVVFIAVTAEESGLLGSLYYARNPLFPLETTAGGINMDGLNVYGPTGDVSVVGYNASKLQDYLYRHAQLQNRVLIPEKYPERGYFYRSDHINLVRKGVPMIYANSGEDFIGRDEEYAKMIKTDREARYHSTNDVIHDLWDWDGLYQNLWLFFEIGKELANNNDWPQWNEGSEFRAIREISEGLRRK